MRSLEELSLQALCFGFEKVARILQKHFFSIPAAVKSELLQRLVDHDLLTCELLPSITYNLISSSLTEINFHGSLLLNDELLSHISKSGCRLERLVLSRCPKVTDTGLGDLFISQNDCLVIVKLSYLLIRGKCLDRLRSSKLRSLSVVGCANALPESICGCVVSNANSIAHLSLKGLRKMPSTYLVKMIDFVGPNLEYLNLSECVQVNDTVLLRIAERCQQLKTLKVRECMNFFELSLIDLFERCQQLVVLDLSFCVRDEVSNVFHVLPKSLQTFRYYGITTSMSNNEIVTCFNRLDCLTSLALNGLNTLSDDLLECLLSVVGSRLESLDLSASFGKFTDRGVHSIVRYCSKLRCLGLGLLSNLSGEPLLQLLENAERAAKLESLHLSSSTALHDSVLHAICSNCPNLKFLDLSGIQRTSDALIIELASTSRTLERVLLKGSRSISDASVCILAASCPYLKTISLSGIADISDRSLFALASHCAELEEVFLSGCMVVSQAAIQFLKDSCRRRLACYHIVSHVSNHAVIVAKNLDTGEFVRLMGS